MAITLTSAPTSSRTTLAGSWARRSPSTAQLLKLVETHDQGGELVALGIALHHFTEPARAATTIDRVTLHQATTVLTKQIAALLDREDRLERIAELVGDPHRLAAPDGRTAAQLCGEGWSVVRDTAIARAAASADGVAAFGEQAILQLAATRAVSPNAPWWAGTGWPDRVERYLEGATETALWRQLMRAPETVSSTILAELLDR